MKDERRAPSGLLLEHDAFALAYAAAEIKAPGKAGNGSSAYLKVAPSVTLESAQNRASAWLKRPDVAARVAELLLESAGAEHVLRAGAVIDDLLLEAIGYARKDADGAVLGRLVELADRGRLGGAKFIKETRSSRVPESPFKGKTPAQIRAEIAQAEATLAAYGKHESKRSDSDQQSAGDRGGEPVH